MGLVGILIVVAFIAFIGGLYRGYNPLGMFLALIVVVFLLSALSRPGFYSRGYYMGPPECGYHSCYAPHRMMPPYYGYRGY